MKNLRQPIPFNPWKEHMHVTSDQPVIRDNPYKFRWMFSSTIDLSFERRENRGERVQEGRRREKKKKEMESTRDREKKHGTRLVPCTRFVLFRVVEIGIPAEGPPLSTPSPHPITTPLNGFKRPRRRQWGRHATGLANLPHQLAKKFLIYRSTDFYLPSSPLEKGGERIEEEESGGILS